MKKKILSTLLVLCTLSVVLNHNIVKSESIETPPSFCYGFILPSYVSNENITIEYRINCQIHHMINDCLREEINTYWTQKDVHASVRTLHRSYDHVMLFNKGSFIVPFTNDMSTDKKLIAIVGDYNQSCEINQTIGVTVPVYVLLEPLDIEVSALSEVRIAQYTSNLTTDCDRDYLTVAERYGFLTFRFLTNEGLSDTLNSTNFNVVMWPGSNYAVRTTSSVLDLLYEDVRYNVSTTIRRFVANGGGYIGSCLGAYMASSAVLPVPVYLMRWAYTPHLPGGWGICAISDVITRYVFAAIGPVQSKLVNTSHPVTYGLDNDVVIDNFQGGPQFVYLGRNSQVNAAFHNISRLGETPSWVSSTFGNGKIVLFSTHPEWVTAPNPGWYGGKIVSNALWYTTATDHVDPVYTKKDVAFVIDSLEKTRDVSFPMNESSTVFAPIEEKIHTTVGDLHIYTSQMNQLFDIIIQIYNEDFFIAPSYILHSIGSTWLSITRYLSLMHAYLNNTRDTLEVVETIIPLFENDTDFVYQLETIKNRMDEDINTTQYIVATSGGAFQNYKDVLVQYADTGVLRRLLLFEIQSTGRVFLEHITRCMQPIVNLTFNSVKFLRTSWYTYEASLV